MPQDSKAGRTVEQHRTQAPPSGINYLLVIAIDNYVHCPRLYNCVKDAHDLIELLTERYHFERGNIREIFNPAATRANIYNAFRELAQRVTPNDNLLIYFSGHGEYDTVFEQGYWIPVDAEAGRYDQYIPNSEIKTFLSGIKSHHTFLMSDSCFSGALFAKGVAKNITKRYEIDPSRWGLTAGRNEIVSDGKPGDNSPFAESLLYRLRQNTDALGVAELCAHVVEQVQAKTSQTPIGEPLKVEGHKNGQFVFHLKKDEMHDWAATKEENTLAAYELFLQNYPSGTYTEEARATIIFLQDEAAWQQADREKSIPAYERYLRAYPNGRYTRLALEAQAAIEIEEAWQRTTRRNTIPAYREFFGMYPDSQYAIEVETRIEKLLLVSPEVRPTVPEPTARNPVTDTDSLSHTTPPSNQTSNYLPYGFGIVLILLVILIVVVQPWKDKATEMPNTSGTTDTAKTIIAPEQLPLDTQKINNYLRDALVYLKTGDEGEAKKILQQAQQLDPTNAVIKDALVYLNIKESEEAQVLLEKVLR